MTAHISDMIIEKGCIQASEQPFKKYLQHFDHAVL